MLGPFSIPSLPLVWTWLHGVPAHEGASDRSWICNPCGQERSWVDLEVTSSLPLTNLTDELDLVVLVLWACEPVFHIPNEKTSKPVGMLERWLDTALFSINTGGVESSSLSLSRDDSQSPPQASITILSFIDTTIQLDPVSGRNEPCDLSVQCLYCRH